MKTSGPEEPLLTWQALSEESRLALSGKLDGLFGWLKTSEVFDSLAINRQQALLLLHRRFRELSLWHCVRRISNVYGEGGVGIEFTAWPMLRSTLQRRSDFTSLLAGHRNNEGGFRERKKLAGPALHVVMVEKVMHLWAAHFDLYDPLSSPLNLWRHIYLEGWRRQLPDWREVGGPITD